MKEGLTSVLADIAGAGNVSDDPAELYVYGSDSSVHTAVPQAVVRPGCLEDVQEILRYANDNRIPVIPRGSGSGMSGQVVPIKGGIVLDMKRMNRIIEIRPKDTLARVEAGVIDDDLNRALKPYGFFYPPAPASSKIATIGGEIANNSSGIRSVKYGATRDSVLGMKVVMANGSIVTLGANTRVEASGYQLDRLMVGSEGTLGVIVEATIKIVPIPDFRSMGIACFNKLEDAGNTIGDVISSGAQPSMLELMDNVAITAVNNAQNLDLPDVDAIILFECDGNVKGAIDFEMERIAGICENHNGFDIEMSYDAERRARLYMGRKKLFASLSRYSKGYSVISLADDMAVPYSRMAECALKIHEVAEKHDVIMSAYGHCGSGVVHTKVLMQPGRKEKWQDAKLAVEDIYDYVRSIGGTTSGEHGIGISKAHSLKIEKRDSLWMMRAIKKALDPNGILNPGKIQDAPDDWLTATNLRYSTK